MDFDIMSQWPLIVTPIGTFGFLWLAFAKGWLHTDREFKDREAEAAERIADLKEKSDQRIADLKEMQKKSDEQKDSEIAHLRTTAKELADAVTLQSKVQENQLQTAEIVKTVMASLQRSSGHTGPQTKVSQGNS